MFFLITLDFKSKLMFNLNMKRIFILFAMALCFLSIGLPINFSYAIDTTNIYIVTANTATVFEEANFSSKKIATKKHKDKVVLEMENGSVKVYAHEKYNFYKLVEGGYIYADLVCPNGQTIVAIPNFNAQTNSSCKVYFKTDNNIVESEITLKQNEKIFL